MSTCISSSIMESFWRVAPWQHDVLVLNLPFLLGICFNQSWIIHESIRYRMQYWCQISYVNIVLNCSYVSWALSAYTSCASNTVRCSRLNLNRMCITGAHATCHAWCNRHSQVESYSRRNVPWFQRRYLWGWAEGAALKLHVGIRYQNSEFLGNPPKLGIPKRNAICW
jgi:hypothetical protein